MYKGAIQLNIYARNKNSQCDRLVISTYVRKSCYSSTTGRQKHRENQPTESDAKYWKRTVKTPGFLDVICSELKRRPSKEKRAHYELCALIPQVIVSKSKETTAELAQVLHKKWGHLMPLPSSFESELFSWMNQWKLQAASDYESISVSLLLAKQVDNIFFPNVREILKILAVLPMGSTEADDVAFSYSEDPYVNLASQHNDHRMILRFGRHRHACIKYS